MAIDTQYLDADTDKIKLARPALLAAAQRLNDIETAGSDTGAALVGFKQSGVEAVARLMQDKAREVVSAADFGALGGGADDTLALQKAVDYCLSVFPARSLKLPFLCRITASLKVDRAVDGATAADMFRIVGDGGGSGIYVDSAIPIFSTTTAYAAVPVSQTLACDGVAFVASDAALAAYVLDAGRFLRTIFHNCSFVKVKALKTTAYSQSIYFMHCNIRYWAGAFFESTGGAYDIRFGAGCMVEHGEDFVRLSDGGGAKSVAGCSIDGNVIEGLTGTPIRYGGARGLSITNNYFEGNSGPDIFSDAYPADAPSRGVRIDGNFFSQSAANAASGPYSSIVWGAHVGAVSSGNYCDGRLHLIPLNADVAIVGDSSPVAVVHPSSANHTGFRAARVRWGAVDPAMAPTSYGNTEWEVGDVVFNANATGPAGWKCTAGGTPGAWSSFGLMQEGNDWYFRRQADGEICGYVTAADAPANQSQQFIRFSDGVTNRLERVLIGPADSAGVGYRYLRVEN